MSLIYTAVSSYFSRSPFDIQLGPFCRVQNVDKLIKYRDENKYNKAWVYSPQEGPFRVLGAERISKIINEQSNLDPILRLNDAATECFRDIYRQMRLHLKDPNNLPPQLPVQHKSAPEMNQFFDSQGKSLIERCMQRILNGKETDYSSIDRFLVLGGDLNAPINFYTYKPLEGPPLSCLLAYFGRDLFPKEKIFNLMDYLVQKGARLDYTFGPKEDNIVSRMIPSLNVYSYILPWYVKNGGSINFRNADGDSFLHLALFMPGFSPPSNISLAHACIKNDIDVSLVNKKGDHPIHLLCHYGDGEEGNLLLKNILEKDPNQLDATDGNKHTPLYWSIRTGKQLFINTIIAAKGGKIEDNKDFIKDNLGGLAAYIAEDTRQIRWNNENKNIFTKQAIDKNFTEVYMPLLKSIIPFVGGSPENLRNILIAEEEGSTLLHHFAKSCPWITKYLIQEKYILEIDKQLKNAAGETVESIGCKTNTTFLLAIACYNLDKVNFDELIKMEFSLDFKGDNDKSLLHLALCNLPTGDEPLMKKNWEIGNKILSKLLAKKVNPNQADKEGTTPMLYAIDLATTFVNSTILELLNYGADIDQPDNKGMTPKVLINKYRFWDIVKQAFEGTPRK